MQQRISDARSNRIADTRRGIADAERAGERSMATALTANLNMLIADALASGDW